MIHCSNGPRTMDARPAITRLESVVNGRERSFPLSFVHPERFLDLGTASDLLARSGGMNAAAVDLTTSLVQLVFRGLEDSERASCRGREFAAHLLRLGLRAGPQALPAECRPALEVRAYGPEQVMVSFYVERADGFDIVVPAARAIVPEVARLLGAPAPPIVTIGTALHRRVRVTGRVGLEALCQALAARSRDSAGASELRDALDRVLARHACDGRTPDLAFEHNARVLSGLAAASAMFGAATDIVQAEGQTHAARWGGCEPLVRWDRTDGELGAELELPVCLQRTLGVVNAREVETACSIADIDCTRALELACASVGLVASVSGLYEDVRAAAVGVIGASPPPHELGGSLPDRHTV